MKEFIFFATPFIKKHEYPSSRKHEHKWVKCLRVEHVDTLRRIHVRHVIWRVVDKIRSQRLRTQLGHGQDTAKI